MIYGSKQLQRRECCPASVCHLKEHSVAVSVPLSLEPHHSTLGQRLWNMFQRQDECSPRLGDGGMISAVSEKSQPLI